MKKKIISRRPSRLSVAAGMVAFGGLIGLPSHATELIYYPINPSFGGSPLNGPVLLNSAQAQNKHKDPDSDFGRGISSLASKSPLEQFNETLERSILNRLAANASSAIAGPGGGLQPGSVETGNFLINIIDIGGGQLRITTTDKITGASSSFEVAS